MNFKSEIHEMISITEYKIVYTLEDNAPFLQTLKQLDFEDYFNNEKLEELEILNYYKYSLCDEGITCDNEKCLNFYFDAKYDGSYITVSCTKEDKEIEFVWKTGDTHMDDKLYYIKEMIQEEVIPALIIKLISLGITKDEQ